MQHMKLSHLPPPPTLPFDCFVGFFSPCSSCITCYFVQPVISSLPRDLLGCGIWAVCLGLAGGERGSHRAVTAEEKALSFPGATFPSSLTLPACRHCYAPSQLAEQGGWQLCSWLISFYFSCCGCKVINFLWKIRTHGENRWFHGGWDIIFLIFPMSSY